MSINFSQVKKMFIPINGVNKQVKKITRTSDNTVIWKGTWSYAINLGDYVQSVKYSTDNSTWTSITSNTTVEVDSGKTLYIQAENYSSKPSTYQYDYTMTNYNFNVSRTENDDGGNVTIYRTATAVDRYYTITWKNWDGTVLETDTVMHDAMPTYDGSTPTRPSTNTQTFTFNGWDSTIVPVTGNKAYTAQYTASTRYYTISVSNLGTGNSNVQVVNGSIAAQYQYGDSYDFYLEVVDFSSYLITGSGGEEAAPPTIIDGVNYYPQKRYRGTISGDVSIDGSTKARYTYSVKCGEYVYSVRVKSGANGTWSTAGSTRTAYGFSDTQLYWEMISYASGTDYDQGYIYTYSGDTSGNFKFNTGGTYTVNRIRNSSTKNVNVYVYPQRERTYFIPNLRLDTISTSYSFYNLYTYYDSSYIDEATFRSSKFYTNRTIINSETSTKTRGDSGYFSAQTSSNNALNWSTYTPTSYTNPNIAVSFNSASGKLYLKPNKFETNANPTYIAKNVNDLRPIQRIGVPKVCLYNSDDDQAFYVKVESMGYAQYIDVMQKTYTSRDFYMHIKRITSPGTYWLDQNQMYNNNKKFFLKVKNYNDPENDFTWVFNSVSMNNTISSVGFEEFCYDNTNVQGIKVTVQCRTFCSPSIEKSTLKKFTINTPFYICD